MRKQLRSKNCRRFQSRCDVKQTSWYLNWVVTLRVSKTCTLYVVCLSLQWCTVRYTWSYVRRTHNGTVHHPYTRTMMIRFVLNPLTAVVNSSSGSLLVVGQPCPFQGILHAFPLNNLQYCRFISLTQRDKPGALNTTLQQRHLRKKMITLQKVGENIKKNFKKTKIAGKKQRIKNCTTTSSAKLMQNNRKNRQCPEMDQVGQQPGVNRNFAWSTAVICP